MNISEVQARVAALKEPESEEEFCCQVGVVSRINGVSLVKAAYLVCDLLTERALARDGVQLACGKGCSFCCHQMVTCTKGEWEEIHSYLLSRGMLRKQKLRFLRAKAVWLAYFACNQAALEQDPFRIIQDHLNAPCVFLNGDGSCAVYPVRPIDCRTMTSTVRCTQWEGQEGASRCRYPWMAWATNLITLNGQPSGKVSVTPLPHWLATLKF
ncbi:MAG: YkgJ family cysteine cluster protein [Candidatus Doudnabacteria bacterium]|nr:YkgJ family cysteine cluster protein [Candidatus Doudnabacteria bacterium]